jgi:hypothetical protein
MLIIEDQFADTLDWLLEPDEENPGVRYFALTKLLEKGPDDPAVTEAKRAVMASGPVPVILDAQYKEGCWIEEGPGYSPKYTGTVWQVVFLAQFGADGEDSRVRTACEYVLENSRSKHGGFSMNGKPSGMIQCLEGNLCAALLDLGWPLTDARFGEALDWLARSITGEGIAPSKERDAPVRYLRSGNSGPDFSCSANDHLPCAWGAVKAVLALSKVPENARTPPMQAAIKVGVDFLMGNDPSVADYPMGYSEKPSRSWFRFGYPIGYVTDVLQNLETLTALGYGGDPRLSPAVDLILGKRDAQGRWKMEYTYNGKTWVDVEEKGQPSKWVTFRALKVLKFIT